jgi:hypothetical protein
MSSLGQSLRWLAAAIEPLASAANDDDASEVLLAELGWTVPSVPQGWRAIADTANAVMGAVADIIEASGTEEGPDASTELELAAKLAAFVVAVGGLGASFRAELPASFVGATHIDDDVVERLYAYLVGRFLESRLAKTHAVLVTLGIVERTDEPEDAARFQPAFTRISVHWDRITTALTDPAGLARDVYGWGTDALDANRLFDALLPLCLLVGVRAEIHYPSAAQLAELDPAANPEDIDAELWIELAGTDAGGIYLVLFPLPRQSGVPQGLAATLVVRGAVEHEVPITRRTTLVFDGAAQVGTRTSLVLSPGQPPRALTGGQTASLEAGRVGVTVRIADPSGPMHLLSLTERTRIDAQQIDLVLGAELDPSGTVDAIVGLGVTKARFAITPADRKDDGLLAAVMPEDGFEVEADARLVWSATRGVHFAGGAGLELAIPANETLGPIRLRQVGVALAADDDGVRLAATVSGDVSLGPVTLGLDGIGLSMTFATRPGNLGPLDLTLALQPPRAVSIAIDAGPVVGRGELLIEPDAGRYGGSLDVQIFAFGVSAFGLLDTRAPDTGFSLIASIGARFPRIPIGMGFTLDGVGGFIGIHRRADVEQLRAAVRAGGLGALFATSDPKDRAPSLLHDLGRFFPPARGRHLFGPSARIGWGAPQLVAADVALLVEAPSPIRVILLGAVQVGLPTLEHRVIDLRLDVLGVLDLGRGTLAIDASLHDSTLAGYPLTGDLALRLGWGADPHFLVALGGFHPAFHPPAGFPVLRRLQLVAGDNPQLRLTSYLAITSNTAQIGARADLAFRGGGFTIDAHVGFDALFEFVPFHFMIDITAAASIAYRSVRLLNVDLSFVLEGPRPWHAAGEATFGVLWWDVTVDFDETWGDRTPLPLPDAPDIATALRDALARREAWSSELPPGESRWIVPRGDLGAGVRAHPAAALVVRQRVVPLQHDITQFGNVPLAAPQRFSIEHAFVETHDEPAVPVTDRFAPGQFTQLAADDRLAAPSFEAMPSGVRIGDGAIARGPTQRARMEVITRVMDPKAPPATPPIETTTFELVLAARPRRAWLPPRGEVVVHDVTYGLASREDLSATDEAAAIGAGASTYASLREALRHRGEAGAASRLQVVTAIEIRPPG